MKQLKKKFVYTDTRPTNVCWNGVSFPVMPGEVIRCLPEFIATFIPEDKYREVPPGSKVDERPVRHDFGREPVFLRKDPTGGLPMTSQEGPAKTRPAKDPMLKDLSDTENDNPYALPVPDAKLEMGTGLDTPTSPDPQPVAVTTTPPSERVEGEGEEIEDVVEEQDLIPADNPDEDPEVPEEPETAPDEEPVEDEIEDEEEDEDPEDEPEDEEEPEPVNYPTKTQLRGLKVDELKALFGQYNVELPENPTKGPMLEALFSAFYPEE